MMHVLYHISVLKLIPHFFQTIEMAPFFHNSEAITGVRKKKFPIGYHKKNEVIDLCWESH